MKKLLILSLLAMMSFSSSAQLFRKSFSGGMGNGGHPYEIEFKRIAKTIVTVLRDLDFRDDPELSNLDIYAINLDIKMANIEIKNKKKGLKDKFGRRKCALNFQGKKEIQINKPCWEKIRGDHYTRSVFVLHEYLGLSNQEVDHYRLSNKLYKIYVDELKRNNIEITINKTRNTK